MPDTPTTDATPQQPNEPARAAVEQYATRGWTGPSAVTVATGLAIARFVVPILALPYALRAAADSTQSIPLLVLLRPGRLEMLLSGFRVKEGLASLPLVLLAYLPLGILSVWGFFWLGRLIGHRLENTDSAWLARAVPPETFAKVQVLLEKRGPALAFFGRLAGLPPTLMAAAAATSHISARRYLTADFVGAVINVTAILVVGALLGQTYEQAGKWFSIGGFVVIVIGSTMFNNWFQRELDAHPAPVVEVEFDRDVPTA